MKLTFTPLTHDLALAIEPWFDDPDTMRHLGGRDWVHHALNLMKVMPGYSMGDVTVLDRQGFVIEEDGRRVALLDLEVYNDRTASLAIVVAPEERRRGVARRVLSCLWELPDLAGVESVFGCIDNGNEASRRCFSSAGFAIANKPDHEGMLRIEMRRPADSPAST